VLPNPFTRTLQVELELRTSENITVRLIDLYGRVVITKQQNIAKGQQRVTLEVTGSLSKGIYFIEIFQGTEKIYRQKLVRE
jgi:hypothetical protein